MASQRYASFSLVFLAAAGLLLADTAAARGRGHASGDLCANADYPALCKSVVKNRENPAAATEKAIQATIGRVANAKSMAISLSSSQKGRAKGGIYNCRDNYDDAISNLVTSLQNLKARDKGSLNINLSAALSDFVACDDGFKEAAKSSPLAKVNDLLRQLTSNCLALAVGIH